MNLVKEFLLKNLISFGGYVISISIFERLKNERMFKKMEWKILILKYNK